MKKKKVVGYKHGNKISKICFGDSTAMKTYQGGKDAGKKKWRMEASE